MNGPSYYLEKSAKASDDIAALKDWLIKNNLESKALADTLVEIDEFFENAYEFYDLQVDENLTIDESLNEMGFDDANFTDDVLNMIDSLSIEDEIENVFAGFEINLGGDKAEVECERLIAKFQQLKRILVAPLIEVSENIHYFIDFYRSE